jgi:hypothetical protein
MAIATSIDIRKNGSYVDFNAQGAALNALLTSVGLTQTSDTGQINWATNTTYVNTSWNTSYGYEIWSFNDSLQATAPIFIKIEYGNVSTQSGAVRGDIGTWVTVGTGSNGAGTITGVIFSRRMNFDPTTAGVQILNSYFFNRVCYNPAAGVLSICFMPSCVYYNGTSHLYVPALQLIIARSCSDSGTPTGEGVLIILGAYGSNSAPASDIGCNQYSYSMNVAQAVGQSIAFVPGNVSSSLLVNNGAVTVYPCAITSPRFNFLHQLCFVPVSLMPNNTLFTAKLFAGGSTRTYSVFDGGNGLGYSAAGHAFVPAVLWE